MPQIADRETQEAYDAQNNGVVKKGVRVAFIDGSAPDELATKGCRKDCIDQHPHEPTCVLDGCAPNCTIVHGHGKDCASDCRQGHHTFVCQNKHHVKPAGREVFRDVIYVKKTIPGDVLNTIVRPKREGDEEEFPREWEDYKNRVERHHGTSLDLIPFLTEAQKAEFRAANCYTAEDIADMNDAIAQKFMGIHDIRRKVKTFLEAISGKAAKESESKIAHLEKKLEELVNKLQQTKKA